MFIYNNGLAQDCGNSSADALELPQSCAKLAMCLGGWGVDGVGCLICCTE